MEPEPRFSVCYRCHIGIGATYRIVELSASAEDLIVKLIQAKGEFNISVRGTDAVAPMWRE